MIFNLPKKAKEIFFDKSVKGMSSNNVQDAIDELKGNVTSLITTYTQNANYLDAKTLNNTFNIKGLNFSSTEEFDVMACLYGSTSGSGEITFLKIQSVSTTEVAVRIYGSGFSSNSVQPVKLWVVKKQ